MDVQILSIQAGVSKKVGNSFIVKGNALSKQVGLFMPKKKSEVEGVNWSTSVDFDNH